MNSVQKSKWNVSAELDRVYFLDLDSFMDLDLIMRFKILYLDLDKFDV